jgi:hypothetical protein
MPFPVLPHFGKKNSCYDLLSEPHTCHWFLRRCIWRFKMLALFFGCWPVHSEWRIVLYLHSPFLYLCSPYTHPDTKKQAISRVTDTHTHTQKMGIIQSNLKRSTEIHIWVLLHRWYVKSSMWKVCRLQAGVLAMFLAKYFLQFLATLQHELFWKRGILMWLFCVKTEISFYSQPDICTLAFFLRVFFYDCNTWCWLLLSLKHVMLIDD